MDLHFEAQVVVEAWRTAYNTYRPHSFLGGITPAEYARHTEVDALELPADIDGVVDYRTRYLDLTPVADRLSEDGPATGPSWRGSASALALGSWGVLVSEEVVA